MTRFSASAFVGWMEANGVRYLLIGGQAVRLYGSPRVTQDYDFWIHPDHRLAVCEHLEDEHGLELSASAEDARRPIVSATSAVDKVDLFFVRGMSTRDGLHLDFDEVWRGARRIASVSGPSIAVPTETALIELKRIRGEGSAADEEDIRFLRVRLSRGVRGEG